MKGSEPGGAGGEPLAVAPGREGRGDPAGAPGGPHSAALPCSILGRSRVERHKESSEDALPEAGAPGGRGRGCIQPGSGHLAAEVGQPLANTGDVLERGREAKAAARGSLGPAGPWAGCGPSLTCRSRDTLSHSRSWRLERSCSSSARSWSIWGEGAQGGLAPQWGHCRWPQPGVPSPLP